MAHAKRNKDKQRAKKSAQRKHCPACASVLIEEPGGKWRCPYCGNRPKSY